MNVKFHPAARAEFPEARICYEERSRLSGAAFTQDVAGAISRIAESPTRYRRSIPMKCLTYSECADWCAERGFPTRHSEGYVAGPDPDLQSPRFHFVEFSHPMDSGRKVWLARFLYSLLEPSPELLIWLGNWAVWESSQHMPLFTRFRQALGERRPLIEAPGHLLAPAESDDAVSIIAVSLLFILDCHVLSASGRDAVFTSHDEFGWFASRDASIAQRVRKQMEASSIESTDTNTA